MLRQKFVTYFFFSSRNLFGGLGCRERKLACILPLYGRWAWGIISLIIDKYLIEIENLFSLYLESYIFRFQIKEEKK